MPKPKQTKQKEIPKKIPPRPKALLEDLQNRKDALEEKGWEINELTFHANKQFDGEKFVTKIDNAASVEELLEHAEQIELQHAPQNGNSADTVHYIPVKRIIPNSFEPQERRRKTFETEKGQKDIEELGDSILRDGLLQPIQLRPIKTRIAPKGFYEIVFGERRFLAHKANGIETIRCFIRDLTDAQVIELNYKENHKRQEPDPLTDAFTFQYLIDHENYTEEKLADHFATTRKNVRQKLRLNQLIPEAREELASGDLPLKHAYYIATFSEAAQKEIVESGYIYKYGEPSYGAQPFGDFKDEVEENITRRLSEAVFDTSDERLHLKKLKCGDCAENSDNQPLLFDDRLGADAVCLNKKCFELKTNVHFKLKQEEIACEANRNEDVPVETKIAELALVSTRNHVDKKQLPVKGKTILTDQTPFDEPECEFSEIGMAIDGEKKSQKVYVCQNAKCPVHAPKPLIIEKGEISEAERAKKEKQFERNVSNKLRTEVFSEALKFFDDARVFWQFDDLIQRLIVESLWELRFSTARFLNVREILGFSPKDFKDKESARKLVASLDKSGQSRVLFLLVYQKELVADLEFTGSDADTAEIRRITTNFTKLDYDRLEAEKRLELAPEDID